MSGMKGTMGSGSSRSTGAVANAGPLGLCGFALTTFVLSCCNTGWMGVGAKDPPNVVVGLALFYGGVAQGLAGMWEFRSGNTLTATAFTSYAAFWLSYAALLIPSFGIAAAYSSPASDPDALGNALGIFLLGWTAFTLILLVASLRTNMALVALFLCLSITLLLLSVSEFAQHVGPKQAGGLTGIATACIAWYIALSGLLGAQHPPLLTLPVGKIPSSS